MTLVETLFQACALDLTTGVELLLVEEGGGKPCHQLIARVVKRSPYVGINGAVAGMAGQEAIPYGEITEQQAACLTKLKGFNDEAYYYLRHNHRAGFGYLDLSVNLENRAGSVAIGYILLESLGLVHAITGGYNSAINDGRGHTCYLIHSTAYYADGHEALPVGPASPVETPNHLNE